MIESFPIPARSHQRRPVLRWLLRSVALSLLFSTSLWAQGMIAYLALDDQGYWQAWRMGEGGESLPQITTSPYDKSRISWYPDGKALLVSGNQGELVRVDLETGEETPITMELSGMNDAVIAPDGGHIAFSLSTSDSIDDNNIWLADANGTNLSKLTNKQFLQHDPTFSADGKTLYFLSGRGDQSHDIWRFDIGVGDLEQLTAGQLYHFDLAPAPGADDTWRLAFSANRSGNYEIWVWEEGGSPERITDDPALDARPSWSPDGGALAFESSRGGVLNIWRMEADGSNPVQLTDHPGGARLPVWFHGGQP